MDRPSRMPLRQTRRVILDMYEQFEPRVIAEMTGRTIGSIRSLASAMGIRSGGRGPSHAPVYTDRELKLLRESYGRLPVVHLARMLNRTPAAIQQCASRRLGLGRRRARLWSDTDDRVVREQYPARGAKAIARELGRSINAVKHRAKKLGVRRDATYVHPWKSDYGPRGKNQ